MPFAVVSRTKITSIWTAMKSAYTASHQRVWYTYGFSNLSMEQANFLPVSLRRDFCSNESSKTKATRSFLDCSSSGRDFPFDERIHVREDHPSCSPRRSRWCLEHIRSPSFFRSWIPLWVAPLPSSWSITAVAFQVKLHLILCWSNKRH